MPEKKVIFPKISGFFLIQLILVMSFTKVGAFFTGQGCPHENKFFIVLYQKYIILIKNFVAQPCPVKNAQTFLNDMTKISQIMKNSDNLGKITLF